MGLQNKFICYNVQDFRKEILNERLHAFPGFNPQEGKGTEVVPVVN
jgi:hypothetical protein